MLRLCTTARIRHKGKLTEYGVDLPSPEVDEAGLDNYPETSNYSGSSLSR